MVYSDLLSHTFSKSLRRALKKRWAHHSVREQKAYERSPFFCELHRASKKKEEDPCFLILIKKIQALDVKRYSRQWLVWVFFLKANPLVSLLFSRNIDDRFINLVRVSRKNSYSNISKPQWVGIEVFSWKNAPWAERRCKWHQKEPNPDALRGIY